VPLTSLRKTANSKSSSHPSNQQKKLVDGSFCSSASFAEAGIFQVFNKRNVSFQIKRLDSQWTDVRFAEGFVREKVVRGRFDFVFEFFSLRRIRLAFVQIAQLITDQL
jgi:hypothetical protein